ncbi:MAG: class I SAM-dependent methyltransferase, partial [Rivularia sp. ALOHA_DT_140]|nr:class I SAM-dependent methyltransferase [Rivularia sp. ALOHA_DT_140]
MNQQTVLNNVLNNYAKAVEVGAYDSKLAGIGSKCDSVRQYWEDRYTRYVLSPPIRRLLERKRAEDHGLRIIDLVCGAGEGWSILTSLPRTSPTLDAQFNSLMNESDIEFYKGVDI